MPYTIKIIEVNVASKTLVETIRIGKIIAPRIAITKFIFLINFILFFYLFGL